MNINENFFFFFFWWNPYPGRAELGRAGLDWAGGLLGEARHLDTLFFMLLIQIQALDAVISLYYVVK